MHTNLLQKNVLFLYIILKNIYNHMPVNNAIASNSALREGKDCFAYFVLSCLTKIQLKKEKTQT